MKQFMTSTLEQRKDFDTAFTTHPMETGWASEAIFFITVEDVKGLNPFLKPRVQISVDGINWVNEGAEFQPISMSAHYFLKVSHFGGWLRLFGEIEGEGSSFNLTIHLVLKE